MIWVVNATNFIDQLSFGSGVNRELSQLADYYEHLKKELYENDKELLEEVESDIRINVRKQSDEQYQISRIGKELTTLQALASELPAITQCIYQGWKSGQPYSNPAISSFLYGLERDVLPKFTQQAKAIQLICVRIQKLNEQLAGWHALRDYIHEGKTLKRIGFDRTHFFNYKEVLCLEKKSLHTFYPITFQVNSAQQLALYAHKERDFEFAVDPSAYLQQLKSEIAGQESELRAFPNYEAELSNIVSTTLASHLDTEIKGNQKKLATHKQTLADLVRSWHIFTERRANHLDNAKTARAEKQVQLDREQQEKKFKIMRNSKGQYTFRWKRERKSWLEAEFPVYLDIGEDYLFLRTGDHFLQKVMLRDFLKEYLD
jgi:hypothetical protein